MVSISRLFTKTKPVVTIAGETFSPAPLDLECMLQLLFLLAPYVALIETAWPDFRRALAATDGTRPALLSALFQALSEQIQPADITRAFSILLGKEPEWFRGVKPVELIEALPVLDEINDFYSLYLAIERLGLKVKYA